MLVLISSLLVIAFVKDGGGESYDNVVGGGRVDFVDFFVGVVVIMMVATLVSLVVL